MTLKILSFNITNFMNLRCDSVIKKFYTHLMYYTYLMYAWGCRRLCTVKGCHQHCDEGALLCTVHTCKWAGGCSDGMTPGHGACAHHVCDVCHLARNVFLIYLCVCVCVCVCGLVELSQFTV